ncbi:MAG: helix-turn-helix domain-containing protein [Burkholderiales bacterium]
MTDPVGAELKRVREELGLSILEVAHRLKLAPRQVEAIEDERFDVLPGVAFVRGILKNYARLLGLAPEPLIERIAGRFEVPDASRLAERYSQPVPFSDGARRSTFVYLGLSIVVLALGSGVAYQWYEEHAAPAELAQAPANRAPVETSAPVSSAPAAPRPEPKVVEPIVQTELTVPVAVLKEPEKAMPAEKPAVEKLSVAKVPAGRGGVNRLVIRCDEDAWIEVRDANDRMLVSSLNPKGSERIVRARGPLSLVIGNAAHVRLTHNDRPVDLTPHTKLDTARFTLP